MKPLINGKEVGGGNMVEKQSLADVKALWDAWEIHCLILMSLFLQVFLFLTAGMRRRSASRVLSTVLWLAYLSADSVGIFVLGHLAVRASEARHQLMSFWAPFVLAHLGGQDTITAFSKQDNELWKRHLLSLVTQVAVAGYVVVKASWPDRRLRAAMVIMFLSGSIKYAERTICLFMASPAKLRSHALGQLRSRLSQLKVSKKKDRSSYEVARKDISEEFDMLSKDMLSKDIIDGRADDILSDAPLNDYYRNLVADDLPGMLTDFLSRVGRCAVYEYVGACLVNAYQNLYTKQPLRKYLFSLFWDLVQDPFDCFGSLAPLCIATFLLLFILFHYVSTPIALVLFLAAKKGDKLHTSRADITVTYILLVGAIVLDVSSIIMVILSEVESNLPAGILRVANYIRPAWSRKQWSEELAQYSMIRRKPTIRLWKRLGDKDHTPIKEFVLDNLLRSGISKEWHIASSRGQLALQKRIQILNQGSDSARPGKEVLDNSIRVDFPTSVLIWHIATDICYYCGDNASTDSDQMKKDKQVSRELSKYIMYLVFKCGVMLTTNSQYVHDKAQGEISRSLSHQQVNLVEKDAVIKVFEDNKKKEKQDHSTVEIQGNEEPADNENAAHNHVQKLVQSAEALDSPVLPRACEVAQELIRINDEADRWRLIAGIWLEMLYYIAPRCGGDFHYEHLSTGGEFITHVLLLMKILGPFLPPPAA
ncbi:uncharacterized protein LOC133922292 [Phragmites australis]|uniref:uncharacterized protein LOC133922292 n=1 Tax=Phragmites australis TaxID=29695 RepID=UPI002D79E027|nr:uncharacterized protein LOC133922292 [Phragmites australis]